MDLSQNNDQNIKKQEAILQILCAQQLKIPKQQLAQLLKIPIVDRSLGCIFGAFIGDALGMQSVGKMDIAMGMPGGGPFQLAAGQVTDDSEMAIHMLEALLKYNASIAVNQQNQYLQYSIAQQYIKWLASQPFDIGITCNKAIQALKNNINAQPLSLNQFNENKQQYLLELKKSLQEIQFHNKQSLSNGILMRITPLSILHSYLSKSSKNSSANLQQLIYNEAKLTHSHPIALDSSVQWTQMLSRLISRSTDAHTNKQKQLEELNNIFRQFLQKDNNVLQIKNDILKEIEQKQPIIATQKIGYFKHAYHFAIYQMKAIEFMLKNLKKSTSNPNQSKSILSNQINGEYYKNSLRFVIKQGGDTDTNACIIGGFLGAITGFNKLPKEYLVKQLGLKLNPNGRKRHGKFYQPSRGFVNTIRLIRKFIV